MNDHAPNRDPHLLDPTFREAVETLLARMNAAGHDAILWEGWRSFERADELQRKGAGIARSMHCYSIAADIVSASKFWDPPPEFWHALEHEAAHLNLVWGGHFTRVDKPHVQAVPVGDQERVRHSTPEQIAALVRRYLKAEGPGPEKAAC